MQLAEAGATSRLSEASEQLDEKELARLDAESERWRLRRCGAALCRRRCSLMSRAASLRAAASSAGHPNTPQGGFVLKMNGELVLTNVVARDAKTGEVVQGLKQSDFTIYENGKQQQIDTFDFESVDMATPLNEATVSGLAAGASGNGSKAVVVAKPEDLRNHRLIVMFFDLTSMQPEDLDRSVLAAQDFLQAPRCSRPTWWRWFRSATR